MTDTEPSAPIPTTLEEILLPLTEAAKKYRSSGELAQARGILQQAIQHCQRFGDTVREGSALQMLAAVELDNSNFETAFQLHQKAIELHTAANRRDLVIPSISGIGYIYQVQGQYELALANAVEALSMSRECGNRRFEALMLGNLAVLHIELKQLSEAKLCLEQALEYHRADGHREQEAQCLIDYSKILTFQDALQEAIDTADQAIEIAKEMNLQNKKALALSSKGLALLEANRWAESAQCTGEALAIFREIGNRRFVTITLSNYGLALQNDNRPEAAEAAYREVIELCRASDDHHSAGYAMLNLGVLLISTNRFVEAERLIIEAVEIYRGAHNDAILSVALFDLAVCYITRSDWAQANDCISQAIALDNEWVTIKQNPLLYAVAAACCAALGDWKESDAIITKLKTEESNDDAGIYFAIKLAEGFRSLIKGNQTLVDEIIARVSEKMIHDNICLYSEIGVLRKLLERSKNAYR
ncbi:MAG: tetratricopeptide repeat protein [bacterium]|nr:tetratricopeptide repeat protein [bacterium]